MTLNEELFDQIQFILGRTTLSNLTSSTDACDLFEVYVFTLIIEAAQKEGAAITYENVRGQCPPPAFIFRTSPGQIYSRQQDYTHAVIQFLNAPSLEVHVGVRVTGRSGVLHECDVAVIHRDEAISCRQGNASPRHSKLLLSVECKFYASSIPLHQARSFMGLLVDIPKGDDRFFVVNTHSDTAEKLLAHHDKRWEHHLTPNSITFVNKLRAAFEKKFANFKAKHT